MQVFTLKPSLTKSCRFKAACVQVIAMILASFTKRYLDLSSPLRSSSEALNSYGSGGVVRDYSRIINIVYAYIQTTQSIRLSI